MNHPPYEAILPYYILDIMLTQLLLLYTSFTALRSNTKTSILSIVIDDQESSSATFTRSKMTKLHQ